MRDLSCAHSHPRLDVVGLDVVGLDVVGRIHVQDHETRRQSLDLLDAIGGRLGPDKCNKCVIDVINTLRRAFCLCLNFVWCLMNL